MSGLSIEGRMTKQDLERVAEIPSEADTISEVAPPAVFRRQLLESVRRAMLGQADDDTDDDVSDLDDDEEEEEEEEEDDDEKEEQDPAARAVA
jgi:hypothetical protein